jgi:pantoate--beta-alanine ligase
MQILRDVTAAGHFIETQRRAGKSVGLVPTMGALHQGHLSLVSRCVAENDVAIASVFVNPIQFNNANDLLKYPRTLDLDTAMLNSVGCHAVFCPTPEEMYAYKPNLTLDFGYLDKILEGQFRPGHFNGVGIVVSKLFNILQPDWAYFGQKDFQQFMIIKQLVQDLSFPVKLVCAEIIREQDGLAMSSRNQRLSQAERQQAPIIYDLLKRTAQNLSLKSLTSLKEEAEKELSNAGLRLEYLALAERDTLKLLDAYSSATPVILLIAAYVGDVRLIDNIFC